MIYSDRIHIEGVKLGINSPIPILREIGESKYIPVSDQFTEEEKKRFGEFSNTRILPYTDQNNYTRQRSLIELKTLVIENKYLRVVVLPEYGGRVYSIYHKVQEQELLHKNPVMQPANLSIRNAWFSGGIEWNLGHLGHSCLTFDCVHFGKVVLENGEEVLRLYEFERMHQLYYQIDFYLGEESQQLATYTKIMNVANESKPLYYWSNIAVDERDSARVLSKTANVIYVKPYLDEEGKMINTFSKGELPYLEGIDGDASYPGSFLRSNEYFYQNEKENAFPFEAVAYKNGYVFYETSTQPLTYRKMFCWGAHKGGKKWQKYLSQETSVPYIEIQAGLAPTQLHVNQINGCSEISFMQVFGGLWLDSDSNKEDLFGDLDKAKQCVEGYIREQLSEGWMNSLEARLKEYSNKNVSEILFKGHNFGYLEMRKNQIEQKIKFDSTNQIGNFVDYDSIFFAKNEVFDSELYLEHILELYSGSLWAEDIPVYDLNKKTPTIVIDLSWEDYFLMAIEKDPKNRDWYLFHLGVMYFENGCINKAEELFEQILHEKTYAIVALTLGSLYQRQANYDRSQETMLLGMSVLEDVTILCFNDNALLQYVKLLSEMKNYNEIWKIYEQIKSQADTISEEIRLIVAQSAFVLEKWSELDTFFELPLERIREGDNTLVELWYKRQCIKGAALTLEEAKTTLVAPENIDFRML